MSFMIKYFKNQFNGEAKGSVQIIQNDRDVFLYGNEKNPKIQTCKYIFQNQVESCKTVKTFFKNHLTENLEKNLC